MKGHPCESESDRKNGCYQGVQRYICTHCGRSFTRRGERFSKSLKAQALQMYLNNVGIRKIARFVKASPAGVLKWIRAAQARLSQPLEHAQHSLHPHVPDVIEMNEIDTFVQKNSNGPSYGLLRVERSVALLPIRLEKA